ncbi:hypothetical protein GQ42DRAFT_162491 [Ramicandelaber brevisporus]|nr:hypothetical protein GQ42DRAFT_162491 [Ramicandelaber brevisporus]
MSFDINWSLFDEELAQAVQERLNRALLGVTERVSMLRSLSVSNLHFGSVAPEVALADICDPYSEFYVVAVDEDDSEAARHARFSDVDGHSHHGATYAPSLVSSGGSVFGGDGRYMSTATSRAPSILASPTYTGPMHLPPPIDTRLSPPAAAHGVPSVTEIMLPRSNDDIQLHFDLAYSGDMSGTISTEIVMNNPTPGFISLPVTLHLTSIRLACTIVVAKIGNRINFTLMPLSPTIPSATSSSVHLPGTASVAESHHSHQYQYHHQYHHHPQQLRQRREILEDLVMRADLGERADDSSSHVLRNVEKVSQFVLEQLRLAIDRELVFPNYHTIMLPAQPTSQYPSGSGQPSSRFTY